MADDRTRRRELLEATHVFPGSYVFKAFGPAGAGFEREVLARATGAAAGGKVSATTRRSRAGRSICVTLEIEAASADVVLDVYAALSRVEGLRLLL